MPRLSPLASLSLQPSQRPAKKDGKRPDDELRASLATANVVLIPVHSVLLGGSQQQQQSESEESSSDGFHWTLVVFRRYGAASYSVTNINLTDEEAKPDASVTAQFEAYGSGGTPAVRAICELFAPLLFAESKGGGVPSLPLMTMEAQEALDIFDDGMYLVGVSLSPLGLSSLLSSLPLLSRLAFSPLAFR